MIKLLASEGDVDVSLQETDDEGIERDSGDAEDYMMMKTTESYPDSSICTLKTVIQVSLNIS